jgi:hypothetical protein
LTHLREDEEEEEGIFALGRRPAARERQTFILWGIYDHRDLQTMSKQTHCMCISRSVMAEEKEEDEEARETFLSGLGVWLQILR